MRAIKSSINGWILPIKRAASQAFAVGPFPGLIPDDCADDIMDPREHAGVAFYLHSLIF